MDIIFIAIIIILCAGMFYFYKQAKTHKNNLDIIESSFDDNVIFSRTDLAGRITHVSMAFCELSGYSFDELIGQPHNIVRHPDMPASEFEKAWVALKQQQPITVDIKNRKKDGDFYWVESHFKPEYKDGEHIGYSAVRLDITDKKEVHELSLTLDKKVKQQTKKLTRQLDVVKIGERKQEQLLLDIAQQEQFVSRLINSQQQIIITSDGVGLQSVNKAFLRFFNVSSLAVFSENHESIAEFFNENAPDDYLQAVIDGTHWLNYVASHPDDAHKAMISKNEIDYVFSVTAVDLEMGDGMKSAVFTDITVMEASKNEVEDILSNILLPVLITSKKERKILYANKYAEIQYEMTLDEIIGSDIDSIYTVVGQHHHIIDAIKRDGFVENMEESFKTASGKEFTALLSVTPTLYHGVDCYIGMITDITKQKVIEDEIRAIHQHTRESIQYASLIQGAVLPDNKLFGKYFKDFFVVWHPKDTVGGDIYLFDELRTQNECLFMFIDCTGHGVPGAFVTMLVKAVERQIVAEIKAQPDLVVSPAWVLSYFNQKLKVLLKQETKDSISNAGWDGGVIYYNREQQVLKFSGAETSLFYVDVEGEFHTIKGNRYSVGYKKCAMDYEYKETILDVKPGMKFYCTTDGYIDQNGGEKDFPFGKKRFGNIIKENHTETMVDQQEIFLYKMFEYESMIENNDRNDDMTVIAFEIEEYIVNNINDSLNILEYNGVLTQNLIGHNLDILDHSVDNEGVKGRLSTLLIEMTQNMINYSKSQDLECLDIRPAGFIRVIRDENADYWVESNNIVSLQDKEKIEQKLREIQALDMAGIKKRYRELRRSGENTHSKGGGIGFYEIAKLAQTLEFKFTAINKEKFAFKFKVLVIQRKKSRAE